MRHHGRLIATGFLKKRTAMKLFPTIKTFPAMKPYTIMKPIKLHKLNICNTNHHVQNENKKESVNLIDDVKYYVGTPIVALVTVYLPLYLLDKISYMFL
jgi:hypothetical protein